MRAEKAMRSYRLFCITGLLAAVLVAIGGCQTPIANPVAEAQTTEQQAWASYGIYVVMQEQAAMLYKDCSVPSIVRQALKRANDATYSSAERLVELVTEVANIRAEIEAAGATDDERLAIALSNLATYYYSIKPKLEGLQSEVGRAKHERGSVAGQVGVDGCDRGPVGSNSPGPSVGVPGGSDSAILGAVGHLGAIGVSRTSGLRISRRPGEGYGAGWQPRADKRRMVRVAGSVASCERGIQSAACDA